MLRSAGLAAGMVLATNSVTFAEEGADWLVPGNSFVYESTSPDYETSYYVDIYLGKIGPWMLFRELIQDDQPFVYAVTDYNVLFTECDPSEYDDAAFLSMDYAEDTTAQIAALLPEDEIEVYDGLDGFTASLSDEFGFDVPGVSDTPILARTARLEYPGGGGLETFTTSRDGAALLEIDWGEESKDTLINIVETRTPLPEMTEERARDVCPGIFEDSSNPKNASKQH